MATRKQITSIAAISLCGTLETRLRAMRLLKSGGAITARDPVDDSLRQRISVPIS